MSSLQYSTISNLKNNNCGYRVIPDIDKNIVRKVEAKNDNILGCNTHNSSKVCPVLSCNDNQENNEKIYKRNFSDVKLSPIPSMRPGFKICNKYKDLNTVKKSQKTHNNQIIGDIEHTSSLFPGKAPASQYFKHIDIESNLKRLKRPNTNCPQNKFNRKHCNLKVIDSPDLLDRPMCQNYKFTEYTNNSDYYKYKDKCNNTKKIVRGYTCQEQISDIRQKSQLRFNYEKRKDIPCNTGCLPPLEQKLEIRQPLLYGNRHNMLEKPVIQIGPERNDHLVENLWNNVSKRKYIYEKNN